jgi:hypothetical protein
MRRTVLSTNLLQISNVLLWQSRVLIWNALKHKGEDFTETKFKNLINFRTRNTEVTYATSTPTTHLLRKDLVELA